MVTDIHLTDLSSSMMDSFFFFDSKFSQFKQVLTEMETKTPFDSLPFILKYFSRSIGMPETPMEESRLSLQKVSLALIARPRSNDSSMSLFSLFSMHH